MIRGFGNRLAEDLFHDRHTKRTRSFPPDLRRAARRKILYLHDAATLTDLRVPPSNHLERLKGDLAGFHSIRVNDQRRLIFKWCDGDADEVALIDYHS